MPREEILEDDAHGGKSEAKEAAQKEQGNSKRTARERYPLSRGPTGAVEYLRRIGHSGEEGPGPNGGQWRS